ncbi:MAG: glucose-6-phosphate isomerase [Actinomycetota bacterium]|nr:glucose-6-phosphate isomerase [Actinomycetota bacterium]
MATDPMLLDSVSRAVDELRDRDALSRLVARDTSLWSDDPEVRDAVANRLGWLSLTLPPDEWAPRIARFVDGVRADGLHRVILAGMGGSSLAPQVFASVFGGDGRGAELVVLESTHPDAVRAALDESDLSHTLVLVSSKSGTTEETNAFAARAEQLLASPDRLAAITDPGTLLEEKARDRGWRDFFLNPPDIGGRYSALSYFGMVPAALVGADLTALWRRADAMLRRCVTTADPADSPAVQLAAFMAGLAREGRDKLTVLAPTELATLGDWIEQLVAESTGKLGTGIVPIVGEPIGMPEVYGDDRAFVSLRLGADEVLGVDDLAAAGLPMLRLDVDERLDLGAEFVRWELATALAGVLLGINPFDEPNVAESKEYTSAVLEEIVDGGGLPPLEDGAVGDLLHRLRPGDYLSIHAYLAPSEANAAPLRRLRLRVRDRWRLATTCGWGPRFLHSTGQLHKGGPDSVAVLQIVEAEGDPTGRGGLGIPGRPYDFATLLRAQAAGDLRSLRAHDRRVVQVAVDEACGAERLADAVGAATR